MGKQLFAHFLGEKRTISDAPAVDEAAAERCLKSGEISRFAPHHHCWRDEETSYGKMRVKRFGNIFREKFGISGVLQGENAAIPPKAGIRLKVNIHAPPAG